MPYHHLTESERKVIFYLNMVGMSKARIGQRLGRTTSTITREVENNRFEARGGPGNLLEMVLAFDDWRGQVER